MGIPGFFRWLKKKYPNCAQKIDEDDIEDVVFDNLYIDMNGVIHPCFHPERMRGPRTYDEVFQAVFKYLDRIFAVVRPRKLLFMAVDGVAPRAKMNHQRSRRFRAAKEALNTKRVMAFKSRKRKSPLLEQTMKMDSNVITPGTEFMELLSSALRYYIYLRMNEDSRWRGIKVILSDSSVPGEGEHKIMSYIRLQRNLPGFDPNTRHCLYGLDADLIMLALTTHEIHFTILREHGSAGSNVVNNLNKGFRGQKRKRNSKKNQLPCRNIGDYFKKMRFQFVKTWILREYLARGMKISDPGVETDMERLIDDFVFLCLFVGNDFIPNLPTFEVSKGALNLLMKIYKDEFVQRGGYLTDSFEVNLERVEHLLKSVGTHEHQVYQRKGTHASEKHRKNKPELDQKERFYAKKFKAVTQDDRERIRRQSVSKYIEGVCWVMRYYYEGVCSWQWFYPYHYAPFASDFCGIDQLEVRFALGEPFKPLNQLMAVLPAASAHALPLSYRKLMTDAASPILDFYPDDFEVDMEGKLLPWQATCILPFIEESRLLEEIAKVEHNLTDGERQRNTFGVDVLFIHRSQPLGGKINSLRQQISSQPELLKGAMELEIDPKLSDGMNGFICISDKTLWPVEICSPIKNMKMISKNEVISVCYKYPVSHSHIPRPPEGVILPEMSITKEDCLHLNVLYCEKNPCILQLSGPDRAPSPSPCPVAEVSPCLLPEGAGQYVAGNTVKKQTVTVEHIKPSEHRRRQGLMEIKREVEHKEIQSEAKDLSNYNPVNFNGSILKDLREDDCVQADTLLNERDVVNNISRSSGSSPRHKNETNGDDAMTLGLKEIKKDTKEIGYTDDLAVTATLEVMKTEVNQSQANGNLSAAVRLVERKTEKKSRKRKRHPRKGKLHSSNSELNNNFEILKSSFPGEQNNGNAYHAGLDGMQQLTTEIIFGEENHHPEIMKLCEGNKIQSVHVETLLNQSENDVKHQNILVISEQSKPDDLSGGSDEVLQVKTKSTKKRRSKKKKSGEDNGVSSSNIDKLKGLNNNVEKLESCLSRAGNNRKCSDGLRDITTEVVCGEMNHQSNIMTVNENNKIQDINVEQLVKESGVKHQSVLVLSKESNADGFFGGSDGTVKIKTEVGSGKKKRRSRKKKSRVGDAVSNGGIEKLEEHSEKFVKHPSVPDVSVPADLITCIVSEKCKADGFVGGSDVAVEVMTEIKSGEKSENGPKQDVTSGVVSGEENLLRTKIKLKEDNEIQSIRVHKLVEHTENGIIQHQNVLVSGQTTANGFGGGSDRGLEINNKVEGDAFSNSGTEAQEKQSKNEVKQHRVPGICASVDELMTCIISKQSKAVDSCGGYDGAVEIITEVKSGRKRKRSKENKSGKGDGVSNSSNEKLEEQIESINHQSAPGVSVDKLMTCIIHEQSKTDGICGGPDGAMEMNTEVKSRTKRNRRKKTKSCEEEGGGISNSSFGKLEKQTEMDEKYQSASGISVGFDRSMTSIISELDKSDGSRGASVGALEIKTEIGSGTTRSSTKEKFDEGDSISQGHIGKMQELRENGLRYKNALGDSGSVDKSITAVISEQSKAYGFCEGPDRVEEVKTETKSGKKRKRSKKKKSCEGGVADSSGAKLEEHESVVEHDALVINVADNKLTTCVISEESKGDGCCGGSDGAVK